MELNLDLKIPEVYQFLFEQKRFKVMYGGRGGGKCLHPDTKIIMADGTLRAIKDIRIGESVMGKDSLPRQVLAITSGNAPMYKINQTSGIDYIVNDAHILSLKKSISAKRDTRIQKNGNPRNPSGRYPSWGDITNIGVLDWLKQSHRWQEHFRGYRAGLLSFKYQKTDICPYFLGVWLGDGTSREIRITSADEEIIEYCRTYALKKFGINISISKKESKAKDIGFPFKVARNNPIYVPFRKYNLLDNKHIPHCYVANSESVRLKLLAGIIDTDGYLHNNCYQVVQVNTRLAQDIKYLADTLGFRTKIKAKKTKCCNNSIIGSAWNIMICGDIDRIPCLLPRRKVQLMRKNKDFLLSQISVESLGYGEYSGISVDGDYLFLLEDGTVTHNSWAVADALLLLGMQKPLRILCARELQISIADSVHRLLSDRIEVLNLDAFYHITQKSIVGVNGTTFLFKGLKHNYREIKSTEGIDVCWVEEAENVTARSWEVLLPTVRKENSEIWVTFNTKNITDATYSKFVVNTPENALVKKVSWRDNPFFPEVLDIERVDMMMRDKAAYDHVWEGEPDTRFSGAIYAVQMARLHARGHLTPKVKHDPAYPVYTLWDLGYGDTCVVWFYQVAPGEILLIDYYENNAEGVAHYCDMLKGKERDPVTGDSKDSEAFARFKEYTYEAHFVPQDAKKKLMEAAGKSIVEQAWKDHDIRMTVVPETTHANRHAALRALLPKLWLNSELCGPGIEALMAYHYEYNEDMQRFGKDPVHDWSSHACCALELLPSVAGRSLTLGEIGDKKAVSDFYKRRREVGLEQSDPYRVKPIRKKR